MTRRPPKSTRTATLFPNTPLFRSYRRGLAAAVFPRCGGRAGAPACRGQALPVPCRAGLLGRPVAGLEDQPGRARSEEHTSELQSLMRISYAVFCLKTNTHHKSTKLTS